MRRAPNEVVDFRFNLTGHVLHAFRRFYPVRVRSRVLAAPPPPRHDPWPGRELLPRFATYSVQTWPRSAPGRGQSGSTQRTIFRLPAQVRVVSVHLGGKNAGTEVKKPVASGRD
jgi:hypothetical protein